MALAPDALLPLPLPALPLRPAESHKGSFGTVLIAAGSRRYPGAAILAALGAGRAGAGLVQLALPEGLVDTVLPAVPFATLLRCAQTEDGGLSSAASGPLLEAARAADSVVAGPGLGTHAETGALLGALLAGVQRPLVLDADGLNLLAARRELLAALRARRAPAVLTPHPGEFARLTAAAGWPAAEGGGARPSGREHRRALAARLARETGAVVVLKGHGTVVTDGERAYEEQAGNPGMATGGTGDVLSGALGALLCLVPERLPDAAAAATLAVHAHAVAGDFAAGELGEEGLLPEDLARHLGRALAASRGPR
jgi:NAD(P)H-hydrate epimerase